MSRAEGNGLALLVDHNSSDMVGRIRNVRLEDGKIRGDMVFSQSERAQEIKQDVLDGIRVDASIGYQVNEWTERKLDGGGMEYVATRWTPLEGSLVAVPADASVGVGRSAIAEAAPTPEVQPPPPTVEVRTMTAPAAPAPAPDDIRAAERKRVSDIHAFRKTIKEPKLGAWMEERMSHWLSNGTEFTEVRNLTFDEMARVHEAGAVPPNEPDLTEKDVKSFSIARAVQSLLNGKREGFEFELSDEIAKKQERSASATGFFVPWQVQAAGMLQGKRANELTVATQAAGGYLKFTEYAGFIDLMRDRLLCAQFGMRTIPGLQGDFQWVRKTAGSTFAWQSTKLTNQTNSAWTLSPITLQPKIGQDALIVSRKMLMQSSEALEPLMRDEINQSHAVGIEKAVLNGSGASGQPTGIALTSGIGDVAGGTNGLQPTYANVLELWSDVATANADVGQLAYMAHPLEVARLAQTQRFTSTDTPLWKFGATPGQGSINDIPAGYTTAVPSLQTKGSSTDCTYIYFGAWNQVVLGMWGSLEVVLDVVTLAPSQVKLSSIQMVDVGLLYPAAFSVMKDARP